MPITPYVPNGRMDIVYTVTGLTHKMRLPCSINTPTVGSANALNIRVPASTTVLASAAANHLWGLFNVFYDTSVTAGQYVLNVIGGGSAVPIESGVLTGAGSSGTPPAIASFVTATFKDVTNKKFKAIWAEQTYVPPFHKSYPTGTTALDTFLNDFLITTLTTSLGNWVQSRGGNALQRLTFVTIGLNKRIRRSRHEE